VEVGGEWYEQASYPICGDVVEARIKTHRSKKLKEVKEQVLTLKRAIDIVSAVSEEAQ
jgi:hypothetical protein